MLRHDSPSNVEHRSLEILPSSPDDPASDETTAAMASGAGVDTRLKIWPIPVVLVAALICYLVASVVAILVAALVVHGHLNAEMFNDLKGFQALTKSLTQSRAGFPLIVIIPQVAMIIPALIAANMSSLSLRERLRLVRGRWPIWMWCLAAMGTPLVGLISSAIVGALMKDSESLVEMTRIFRELAGGGFLIPLAILIGLTPGICEELLFRGYIQSRLTTRLGGTIGILITAVLFAAFHMDLVHSTAVFALGVWLGWISWQSGSLFPAMLAHFVNNSLSVLMVSIAPKSETDEVSLLVVAVALGIFFLGSGAFFATIASAWHYRAAK